MSNAIITVVGVHRCQACGSAELAGDIEKKDLGESAIIRQSIPLAEDLLWHQTILADVVQHSDSVDSLVSCIEVSLHQ